MDTLLEVLVMVLAIALGASHGFIAHLRGQLSRSRQREGQQHEKLIEMHTDAFRRKVKRRELEAELAKVSAQRDDFALTIFELSTLRDAGGASVSQLARTNEALTAEIADLRRRLSSRPS